MIWYNAEEAEGNEGSEVRQGLMKATTCGQKSPGMIKILREQCLGPVV